MCMCLFGLVTQLHCIALHNLLYIALGIGMELKVNGFELECVLFLFVVFAVVPLLCAGRRMAFVRLRIICCAMLCCCCFALLCCLYNHFDVLRVMGQGIKKYYY